MSRRFQRQSVEPTVELHDVRRENAVFRVRLRVDELTRPWWERVSQVVVTEDGREEVAVASTEHAALLEQLAAESVGRTAGVRSSASSRPPASLDAVSLLGVIRREVVTLARSVYGKGFVSGVEVAVGGDPGRRTVVLLRDMARRAPVLQPDVLAFLDESVLAWWGRARVATTLDAPALQPHVPCPVCDRWDTLRLRLDPTMAVCRECGSVWDESTVGLLGRHVAMMLVLATQQRDDVAAVVDRGKLRGPGRAGATSAVEQSLLVGVRTDEVLARRADVG